MNKSLKALMIMSLASGIYSANMMASDPSLLAYREGGGEREGQFHSQGSYQHQEQGQNRRVPDNDYYHPDAAYQRGVNSGESQSSGGDVIVVPQNQGDPNFQEPYYPPQ